MYVIFILGDELASCFSDTAQWWAFVQPPLSLALRRFYLLEVGITCEATVAMLLSLAEIGVELVLVIPELLCLSSRTVAGLFL